MSASISRTAEVIIIIKLSTITMGDAITRLSYSLV